ncbi:conserved oligomeric Golgi complex subunit 1 [Neolamprologus brichardi]|uniref:conserved oligomeric Golgi complex subunit 1 n=1 Tax=Neolamprologus brichardi TaxID=32507 RepID=UPI001643E3C7|nr:conserved oligomeric Golgi complex subunit 1 [Neolamprologus brichardi]
MAQDSALSLRVSEISDPALLFERYNTEEIRGIERKVRGEIEQNQTPWQLKFYTTASQIKLLLEIPERVWSAMEASHYLQATQLYLLCCHLHHLLQLEATAAGLYSSVLVRFPILVRQVATTEHFRAAILLDSRALLRGRAVSDQAIAEALVSIMLLEDSSPRQALADFLLARKSSIHQLLNQPQHGAGIKSQVCSLVELLVTTLFQAYAIFYLPPEGSPRPGEEALSCGMLFSVLDNCVVSSCKDDICHGVGSLLVYVTSLKGLAAIRDAVWDLLSADSISQHWSAVCQRLLEHPLAVWEDILQQLFLQRLQLLLDRSDSTLATVPSSADKPSSSSFNRFIDSSAVEEALRGGCLACVHHILSFIRSQLAAVSPDSRPVCLSAVLFMARLCQSMGKLCPNLKHCILGKQGGLDSAAKGTPRQGRKLGKLTEVRPSQDKWEALKEELLGCSMEAYRIWSAALSKGLLEKFGVVLHAESAGTILATATNWEDLEIQEEAESGSSVTSKIRLPVQPTWFVQSLLFQLCVEINRVGGHALPRSTLQEFLQTCLTEVLHHYHSLTQTSSTVCMSYRFHETCDWLESFIDPFDLDVFTPHLNASLNRLSQRTLVLLGLLTGSEKQFALRSSSLNSQDPYNILPLASSQIRFGLLPLSVSHVQKSKAASRSSEAPQQLVAPQSFAAGSDDSFRPGSLFRQLADQDEDTAATSLFKLNWLSGMGK